MSPLAKLAGRTLTGGCLSLLLCLTATASQATLPSSPAYQANVLQPTRNGPVRGIIDQQSQALIWQGIPYAAAPVADLRWQPPADVQPWQAVRDNQPNCLMVQSRRGRLMGNEGCLALDIYRPNTDSTGLPVVLYLHGGNNQVGSRTELDARHLARLTDSVVVTISYRLGLLGFNNLPALRTGDPLTDSGNFALLDMLQALDWVADNIASFGGDANNITLAGFSAGGRDVLALMISPLAAGKFHKAISISGGMTLADYDASSTLIAEAIAPLAVADGRQPNLAAARRWLLSNKPDVSHYLHQLSAERLAGLMTNAEIRMAVFPHLFNDGHVIPHDGFARENAQPVPLLLLTSSDEFSVFARFDDFFRTRASDATLLADNELAAAFRFANHYGSTLYQLFNSELPANTLTEAYPASIYIAELRYGQNAELVGQPMAHIFGAFHGVWLPLLNHKPTGFSTNFAEAFKTPGARDLANQFNHYLGNFFRTGNPNGSGLKQWPAWQHNNQRLILDANDNRAQLKVVAQRTRSGEVLAAMQADQSVPLALKNELIQQVLSGRWFSYPVDQFFGNNNQWIGVTQRQDEQSQLSKSM